MLGPRVFACSGRSALLDGKSCSWVSSSLFRTVQRCRHRALHQATLCARPVATIGRSAGTNIASTAARRSKSAPRPARR
eukprot:294761-Pyramimonas_sp.AAC.1